MPPKCNDYFPCSSPSPAAIAALRQSLSSSRVDASLFTILNKLCDLAPAYLIGVAVDVIVEQEDP